MLYEGSRINLKKNVLLIDDIKTYAVIGSKLRHEGLIDINAPDPYFTVEARSFEQGMDALRYPLPSKWDCLFLDQHLHVDRHDDKLGTQICDWLRINPYFLPKEVYLISDSGPDDKKMSDILRPVYINCERIVHLYTNIFEVL